MTNKPAPSAPCKRCGQGKQIFHYLDFLYVFDVDRALRLIADGREPVEVDEKSLMNSLVGSEIEECHLAHVDLSFPGLIAHVEFRTRGGELLSGHALIDGNHRAVRCLREKRPFFAHVLTEEESRSVLLQSPERLDPMWQGHRQAAWGNALNELAVRSE